MTASADQWGLRQPDGEARLFPAFVMQSLFDHPFVVFQKGRRRVDSRVPSVLRAAIAPRIRREGARIVGTIQISNLGDTVWLGGTGVGRVSLGIQLLSAERKMINLDFFRVRFDKDVAPSADAAVDIDFCLPDAETPFVLKLDLVDEGICWFEDAGSKTVYQRV